MAAAAAIHGSSSNTSSCGRIVAAAVIGSSSITGRTNEFNRLCTMDPAKLAKVAESNPDLYFSMTTKLRSGCSAMMSQGYQIRVRVSFT